MDTITQYTITIRDQIMWWCLMCDMQRFIWQAKTAEGETITGCTSCQRILQRKKTTP